MARLNEILKIAMARRASDIHFASDEPIQLRIDGDLAALDGVPHPSEEVQSILFEILNDSERERIFKEKNLDKSHEIKGVGFFRVNIFWTRKGISAVLRTIPKKIPTIEDLKLPEICVKFANSPKGLVLVTGPTGSGKSTTLAAMINYINANLPYHILTVEDPVEFVHASQKSLINQREIGNSCHTFADALKYALREDPDVILVGEMRDLETIALALTAAETGHLVFGTLHTRGAGASIDRIIDSFPSNQQAMIRIMLSESLVGVVSQSLLKRCDQPGRIAAFEIMAVNHAISNLIREGKTFQIPSIMQTGRKDGMILMDQYIIELVTKGIVSADEGAVYMEDSTALHSQKKKAPAASSSSPRPALAKPSTVSKPPPLKVAVAAAPTPTPAPAVVVSPAPTIAPEAPVEYADESPQAVTDLTGEAVPENSDPSEPPPEDNASENPFSESTVPMNENLIEFPAEAEPQELNEAVATPEALGQIFESSEEIAETLDLPNPGEFAETKVVDRDEFSFSQPEPEPEPEPEPQPVAIAVPQKKAAIPPPPARPLAKAAAPARPAAVAPQNAQPPPKPVGRPNLRPIVTDKPATPAAPRPPSPATPAPGQTARTATPAPGPLKGTGLPPPPPPAKKKVA